MYTNYIFLLVWAFVRNGGIDVTNRPSPTKWSKKEILGHLCDSAIMNIERFIKIQYEKQPYALPTYNQGEWVAKPNYQDTPIEEILTLFYFLNGCFRIDCCFLDHTIKRLLI
ncbi:hypothetical protein [Viridibacillus arvi]|uniref:hypothetical protein n=1 Tax=Viridibacillus arvi TaxID=263475 RepID=UPI000AD6B79E|nr:hypothetical protein [Viridibacillus arvi]